jgi:hypothetical protein
MVLILGRRDQRKSLGCSSLRHPQSHVADGKQEGRSRFGSACFGLFVFAKFLKDLMFKDQMEIQFVDRLEELIDKMIEPVDGDKLSAKL